MDSIKCLKFQHETYENVNIAYNVFTRNVIFWNKFQIFLFEEVSYEKLSSICQTYITEFKIVQVILSSNHIICLDYCGDLYLSPLKLKLKNTERNFQLREKGILCISYNEEVSFSLQKNANKLDFCVHKINSEFQLVNKIPISFKNIQSLPNITYEEILFHTYILNETEFIDIKDKFELKNVNWSEQIFFVLSFDNLTLYAALICIKTPNQEANLIQLFSCPSQIINVSFFNDNHLCVVAGLASGTLIKISLSSEHETPNIIHLNTAIAKCLSFSDTVIYTDGVTMWKTTQTYSERDISFKEFTVRHVKDFIKVAETIVCVTYTKMIYLIPLEDETCYIKPPTTDEYCSTEYPLSNTNYVYQIIEEIEKNDKIIETIKMEENYITTLALSNRKDIMDDVIHYKIIVFDNYDDILKEEIPLSITNNIAEYFDIDSYYFLIKITISCHLQQKFSDVLSNLFGNLKIHITLLSEQKVLRTNSIKVQGQLKDLNIVVPLNAQMLNFTNITVNINLVTLIPGAFNEKEVLWANLHYRTIVLNSEHFIKSKRSRNNVQLLKEPKKSINDLIFETACNHHGQLFKINEVPNMNTIKWLFYVKLPTHYEESLNNRDYYFENFNISKATYLFNEISSKDFLKSKSTLCFSIGNNNVEIELSNDGFSDPMVKVTSHNPQIALNVRNFISNLAYNMFKNCKTEFVSNGIYESIEELEKSFKLCTLDTVSSEEFCRIFHQYQKCIMGAIVI